MKRETVIEEVKKEVPEFPGRHLRNQIVSYDSPGNANQGLQLFNNQGWRAVQICAQDNQVIVLLESSNE